MSSKAQRFRAISKEARHSWSPVISNGSTRRIGNGKIGANGRMYYMKNLCLGAAVLGGLYAFPMAATTARAPLSIALALALLALLNGIHLLRPTLITAASEQSNLTDHLLERE